MFKTDNEVVIANEVKQSPEIATLLSVARNDIFGILHFDIV